MLFCEITRRLSSSARLSLAFLGKLDSPAFRMVRHDVPYDTARLVAGTLGQEAGSDLSDAFQAALFHTALRVRKTRTSAKQCDKTRNLRKLRIRAKLLSPKDFRRFRPIGLGCFPSWTSWVRIPSPAIIVSSLPIAV